MQGLYPIIRRVRRPLFVADKPPVVVGNVEPANANAALASTGPAEAGTTNQRNAKAATKQTAQPDAESGATV
jgi:hypothetical protein